MGTFQQGHGQIECNTLHFYCLLVLNKDETIHCVTQCLIMSLLESTLYNMKYYISIKNVLRYFISTSFLISMLFPYIVIRAAIVRAS